MWAPADKKRKTWAEALNFLFPPKDQPTMYYDGDFLQSSFTFMFGFLAGLVCFLILVLCKHMYWVVCEPLVFVAALFFLQPTSLYVGLVRTFLQLYVLNPQFLQHQVLGGRLADEKVPGLLAFPVFSANMTVSCMPRRTLRKYPIDPCVMASLLLLS